MKGALLAGGEAAANDLLNALLLARAGRGRGVLEGLFGGLGEPAGCDKASEGVGGAVEGVGEACALGDLAAGLDGREDRGEGVPCFLAAAATGG